jgi:hypothetical protein
MTDQTKVVRLRGQFEEARGMPDVDARISSGGDGGDSHIPEMDTRIGRLEGAIEGLRHSQNLLVGIVSIVALIVIGFGVYELQRIDQLGDKVAALPQEINTNLLNLTKTLADSITAAKQPSAKP